jgi:hypothetical protein
LSPIVEDQDWIQRIIFPSASARSPFAIEEFGDCLYAAVDVVLERNDTSDARKRKLLVDLIHDPDLTHNGWNMRTTPSIKLAVIR